VVQTETPTHIFHHQSPTTPTPIANDTHNSLLTVQHDKGHTLCIDAFITSFAHGAYASAAASPRKSQAAPASASPCHFYLCFVILTPFFFLI